MKYISLMLLIVYTFFGGCQLQEVPAESNFNEPDELSSLGKQVSIIYDDPATVMEIASTVWDNLHQGFPFANLKLELADMQELLEKFASRNMTSRHSQTWGDDNGFSHLRASFMGSGITVPVAAGQPVLGTWQQIVVIDHDNRPRSRRIFIQVMGE